MQLAVVRRMTRAETLDTMESENPGYRCQELQNRLPPLTHKVYGFQNVINCVLRVPHDM
jgi:hypothetical protein